MDDLDSLLADLGRPTNKNEGDATNTVNLSELDDLMSDLNDNARSRPSAQPAQPARAAPQPVKAPAPAPARAPAKPATDDLDDLLNDLSSPSKPAPKPSGGGDDLDALLNDLDKGSRSAPAPAKAAPAPSPVRQAPAPAQPQQRQPAPKPAAPAVAADDLDDLLDGLDAPITTSVPSSGGGGGGRSDMDSMFNDINSSARAPSGGGSYTPAPINNTAASGPQRGTCASCNNPIYGEVLQATGKSWHPEHFACGNCHQSLGTQQFFEYEGMPHCSNCYKGLFCPRCAKCDKPITDRIITALGKKWHPDCFTCSTCNQQFPGGSFFERDGYPYCSDHFYSNAVPNCGSCGKPVRGECTNALNQSWHVDCFVCQYCRKAFTDGAFFEVQGKPFCKLHYHANAGSVCGGCSKAITGRSVNAMGKNWHPEHFVCAFCVNPLSGGNYTEKQGKPYCGECFSNLFG